MSEETPMKEEPQVQCEPKNIVICSDGTGNRGGKNRGTNVWRIFNAVDHHCSEIKQVTYYDDGVGTQVFRPLKLFSSTFGWGLSRNIQEAYEFLAMTYNEGDKVFLFGFSRGAFTVRSLAGMIGRCGLVSRQKLIGAGSRRMRDRVLKRILLAYRSSKRTSGSEDETKIRQDEETQEENEPTSNAAYPDDEREDKNKRFRKKLKIDDLELTSIPIHFIGVWDTVDAVGVPLDELKPLLSTFHRLRCRRGWGFNDKVPHPCIQNAYQALALDDERKTFHPNIWNEKAMKESGRTVEQVWFAGSHSNVGGGYPKDALSLVALDWMMGKANKHCLRFKKNCRRIVQSDASAHGRLYDSRAGFGALYRFERRNLYMQPITLPIKRKHCASWAETIKKNIMEYGRKLIGKATMEMPYCKPSIHVSVRERACCQGNYYAPKNLCREYEVAYTDCGPYSV